MVRIPKDQFPLFNFQKDLWHPRFQKKYVDSENFIIVNHDRQGLDTYVELLQTSSKTQQVADVEPIEVEMVGMKCNCRFAKKESNDLQGLPTQNIE